MTETRQKGRNNDHYLQGHDCRPRTRRKVVRRRDSWHPEAPLDSASINTGEEPVLSRDEQSLVNAIAAHLVR